MKHIYRSNPDYIIDLHREELKSEAQRSGMLIVLFLLLFFLVTINLTFFVDDSLLQRYGGSGAFVPSISALILFLFYQAGVLLYVKRKIRKGRKTSLSFKVIHSMIEVTFPSVIMFFYVDRIHMLSFLESPVPLTYFLFIILSVLHLDYRVSLLTGALAALEFVVIVYYGFHHAVLNRDYQLSTPEKCTISEGIFLSFWRRGCCIRECPFEEQDQVNN